MSTFEDIANQWIKGLATYEAGRPIQEVARELGFESAEEIVKMASNENALGPSPLAIDAMKEAASGMHRYPDSDSFYLKRELATRLDLEPGMILPSNGSNETLEWIGHVFLGPDTNIVVAECAFIVYRLVAAMFRSSCTAVPMRNHTHDLDAMLDAIGEATRVVFISNPNNPTSTMVEEVEIERFMDKVPDHVLVCFDEAYIELVPPDRQPDTLRYVREGRKVAVLRTFSKTYGLAGLRVGFVAAPEACINMMHRVRQPFNVNAMGMAGALAALADDEHVRRTREMVAQGIKYFEDECDRIGVPFVPATANFMLMETGRGREVFDALKSKGIIVRSMDAYWLPEYIRVTVGTEEENERFMLALEDILVERGQ